MELVKVQHVSIAYRDKMVVQDVNFSVMKNQITAIVGESGSGKSTLLKTIAGLLPAGGQIVAGHILFSGMEQRMGKEIAMIFQNPGEYLNPRRKIGSQFLEMLNIQVTISRQEKIKLAMDSLARLKLSDPERIMKSYPFQLSGGMNQRVAIAMAISTGPRLLLADEPTSALDVTIQAQVVKELLSLRDQLGTAMIIVTHNIAVAAKMADQILVMKNGRIQEAGSRDQVIFHPISPYTQRLLHAVPELEDSRYEQR